MASAVVPGHTREHNGNRGVWIPDRESIQRRLEFFKAQGRPNERYSPRDGEMALFMWALKNKQPIMLVGSPGTAKTLYARTMASLMDFPFCRVPFADGITLHHQVQAKDLYTTEDGSIHTVTVEGPVAVGARSEKGAIIYLNEIRRGDPAQIAYYMSMTDHQRQLDLPHSKEVLTLPDNCIVIADYNPLKIEGTSELSAAFARRFVVIRFTPFTEAEAVAFLKAKHGEHANAAPDEAYFEALRQRVSRDEAKIAERADLLQRDSSLRERVIEGVTRGMYDIRRSYEQGSLLIKEPPTSAAIDRAIDMMVQGIDFTSAVLTSVINGMLSDLDQKWADTARGMYVTVEGKVPADYLAIAKGKWPY